MKSISSTFVVALLLCMGLGAAFVQSDTVDEQWNELKYEVSPAVGVMRWTPAWKVYVYYDHFDRKYRDAEVFVDRNVNPDAAFDVPSAPITRDSKGMDEDPKGCHVSMASMEGGELWKENDGRTAHQRDWDFLVELKDKILKENNLTDSTDTYEKMKALANYAKKCNKYTYESRHGVDTLLHSSYCVGMSNAGAAFASVMGLKYRTINTFAHSTLEVEIDGKWHHIENYFRWPVMLHENLMELSARPETCEEFKDNAEVSLWMLGYQPVGDDWMRYGAMYNLSSGWWHFNQSGLGKDKYIRCQTLLNGAGVTVGLDGNTAKALYPGEQECVFKPTETGAMLVAGKYTWWNAPLKISQGQKIRRAFYLSKLRGGNNPARKAEAKLLLIPGMSQKFPKDGGEWYLKVNGKAHYLKDREEVKWSFETIDRDVPNDYMPNPAGLEKISETWMNFSIPVEYLQENSLNTIELGSDQLGQEYLHIMVFPDPVLPYHNPFSPGKGRAAPDKMYPIVSDHICEVTKVPGFEYAK